MNLARPTRISLSSELYQSVVEPMARSVSRAQVARYESQMPPSQQGWRCWSRPLQWLQNARSKVHSLAYEAAKSIAPDAMVKGAVHLASQSNSPDSYYAASLVANDVMPPHHNGASQRTQRYDYTKPTNPTQWVQDISSLSQMSLVQLQCLPRTHPFCTEGHATRELAQRFLHSGSQRERQDILNIFESFITYRTLRDESLTPESLYLIRGLCLLRDSGFADVMNPILNKVFAHFSEQARLVTQNYLASFTPQWISVCLDMTLLTAFASEKPETAAFQTIKNAANRFLFQLGQLATPLPLGLAGLPHDEVMRRYDNRKQKMTRANMLIQERLSTGTSCYSSLLPLKNWADRCSRQLAVAEQLAGSPSP